MKSHHPETAAAVMNHGGFDTVDTILERLVNLT